MPALLTDKPAMDASESTPVGLDQGVIEEARRRQRRRRIRITVGALLALAGVGGIVSALTAGGSPTRPQHAGEHAGAAIAHHRPAPRAFNVRVSPNLTGGQYGWCVAVEEPVGSTTSGSCPTVLVSSTPVAMEQGEANRKTHQYSIVLLTTPRVASILVNGDRRVPTTGLPDLPYGLRAARILIPMPAKTAPHLFPHPPDPMLVALDSQGHAIPSGAMRKLTEQPKVSGQSACALHASGLPGLAPQWTHFAAAIEPYPGRLIGRTFFSCVDTEYYLSNWPLDTAILLDAAHPGAPPAAISGLTPVPTAPGIYNGPGDFHGELTAMRHGNAWLIVAGGSGLTQRVEVLRHLTPTIRI